MRLIAEVNADAKVLDRDAGELAEQLAQGMRDKGYDCQVTSVYSDGKQVYQVWLRRA